LKFRRRGKEGRAPKKGRKGKNSPSAFEQFSPPSTFPAALGLTEGRGRRREGKEEEGKEEQKVAVSDKASNRCSTRFKKNEPGCR